MQYILTEEEYKAHTNAIEVHKKDTDKLIGDLCQQIADHKPVKVYWQDEPAPWTCIHSQKYEWYCDDCPVQDSCTKSKHFSK